jgi:hypothetical protein
MGAEVIQNRREVVKQWLSSTLLRAGSNGIPVAQIAEAMGVSDASLYKYASINEEANQIHLHNLLPLLQETGDFFILQQIAELFGYALVPLAAPLPMVKAISAALEKMEREADCG